MAGSNIPKAYWGPSAGPPTPVKLTKHVNVGLHYDQVRRPRAHVTETAPCHCPPSHTNVCLSRITTLRLGVRR